MIDSSDPTRKVLVTGALGNVGGPTVESLVGAGIGVRAGDLGVDRLRQRWGDRPGEIEMVHLDFTDPATFGPALEGCDGQFLLRPPPISRVGPTLNALIDRAAVAGIRHVVFSSVAGADRNVVVPHHRVERHLRASPLRWTMLRPGFFAQNLADAYLTDIVEDHRLLVPAGDGRVAFLDVRDLADVAAIVFSSPHEHVGRGYHLTGPGAVTFDEVAGLLTDRLGVEVRYQRASVRSYVRHLRRRGLPAAAIAVQTVLHVGLRRGDAEEVDPTLGHLLGRPARTVDQYIDDTAATWTQSHRA